jgi:hypothetical protein
MEEGRRDRLYAVGYRPYLYVAKHFLPFAGWTSMLGRVHNFHHHQISTRFHPIVWSLHINQDAADQTGHRLLLESAWTGEKGGGGVE